MEEKIRNIARDRLHINTLETRKLDSLDFHDVAVWSVKAALTDAYLAGMEKQKNKKGKR